MAISSIINNLMKLAKVLGKCSKWLPGYESTLWFVNKRGNKLLESFIADYKVKRPGF